MRLVDHLALWAVLFIITLGASCAHATVAEGTPHFSWTKPKNVPPVVDYRVICDTIERATIPATKLDWQSPTGMFTPGDYSCVVRATFAAPTKPIDSNVETFAIAKPPEPPKPIIPPVLSMMPNAEGLPVFGWTMPEQSPTTTESRIFCDGNTSTAKFKIPAPEHSYVAAPEDFLIGDHSCYVLQFNGVRGPASNTVSFSVVALPPVLEIE